MGSINADAIGWFALGVLVYHLSRWNHVNWQYYQSRTKMMHKTSHLAEKLTEHPLCGYTQLFFSEISMEYFNIGDIKMVLFQVKVHRKKIDYYLNCKQLVSEVDVQCPFLCQYTHNSNSGRFSLFRSSTCEEIRKCSSIV